LPRFTGLLGLAVFLALAYAFSTNRRAIRWRTVVWGLGLQIFFAILVIKWTFGQTILHAASTAVTSLLGHAVEGSSMVFGPLGTPGNPLAVFAFAVLPTIIFISAFFALLYHIGFMQQVIRVVAWIMQRTMGTSGAESTNVAASIVIGPGRTGKGKEETYESGMVPIGDTHRRFNVRFYIVAMIFLVFDVEIVFLYPWAAIFSSAALPPWRTASATHRLRLSSVRKLR